MRSITTDVKQLKKELKEQQTQNLAVDIDETLSWTTRWWFNRMMKLFGNPENLTADEIFFKYRHSSKIPYWQTDEAKKWMEERRLDNSIHEKFDLIENSNEVLQSVTNIIPVVYITARPTSVSKGTENWLLKHHFPEGKIAYRPSHVQSKDGNKWKAEVLEYLYPQVVGVIDDNVDLLDFFGSSYQGTIFLFKYEKLEGFDKLDVIPCRNWNKILDNVNARFKTAI